ncbi:MAG: alpha/beta fold hydrolase [Rhodocyclaceae bacterium]|jgi:dipeptidyl aminopeptidase/acylaminoacyl peptidase|nr:alpha/beta fold hydrolase [Rhodocyclaceae bacterium]MCA3096596.1 alpha/beta fold hydrolase [Rhodocyclaceae bacterium]MCA3104983.1 alpha/beta fold hydrolase [Rhodocyclaceae bacterium]MCA3123226.1 alpha/beta fold hydrolase [Rhodocyclaceae bacterium]MCA3136975.1 alpha/beta fold hydrolase [Rhodocyclaceae bacterium]
MIRKLRTQRDDQQWMLDLALNMRGRVQNFERDDIEVPAGTRARNYRMLPKVWRKSAERHERLAKRAQAMGANATATHHYDHAVEGYRMAQHPIFFDNHPVKKALYKKLNEMVDRRIETASYPIERVEVPFDDGKTISCLYHMLPGKPKAPVVIYVPGMDQTKEVFPKVSHNIALSRGFHVIAIDGPGQGNSNLQKIRAVGDNYERAGAAVISWLMKRPEVDKKKIAIYGISMGSYWCLRLSSYDHRAAAVVSSVACFNPNNTIFTQSSPRFKQMFMYMAGYDDEAKFDVEVAQPMTVRGYLDKVKCPTLLVTGEFDPLCPLEEAVEAYGDLKVPKEMWIMENQYHPLWGIPNLGGMDCHDYVMDWLQGLFSGKRVPKKSGRIAYVGEHGDGPWSACEWEPPVKAGQPYF